MSQITEKMVHPSSNYSGQRIYDLICYRMTDSQKEPFQQAHYRDDSTRVQELEQKSLF